MVTATRMGCRFGADTKLHTLLPDMIGAGVAEPLDIPALPDGGAGFVAQRRGETALELAAAAGPQLTMINPTAHTNASTVRLVLFLALRAHNSRTAIADLLSSRTLLSD
ncbi:hypothetical protein [Frankia sp. Cas4]|uniref:hypothetical protein n=1 Tax=Frankia sp. Cas4 TaxID=3073927 RepID=UPI002AD39531|nr:hypothetical protein [Frankia sp. Cas4]